MNDYVYVPIELNTYRELLNRAPETPNSTIQDVIDDFLERTSEDTEWLLDKKGFFWGRLVLPNGTKLRTKYFGNFLEAYIDANRLIWEKREFTSVSKLINSMRGDTSNNAWKVTEIKRPGDIDWVTAEKLR